MKPYYESELGKLYLGDCLEVLPKLDIKIDMVLTDPPYGTTACKWDSVIPLDKMWFKLERLIKFETAIVLMAGQPFTSKLILSNLNMFRYSLVWRKSKFPGFAQAACRFLAEHEDICVFSKGGVSHNAKMKMNFYPQGLIDCYIGIPERIKNSEHRTGNKQKPYTQTKTNYPKSILEFKSKQKPIHPTQKPIKLMEYLLKSYTKEMDTVLDFSAGSGTTGAACEHLNRKWIMIEKEKKYCDIIVDRLKCLKGYLPPRPKRKQKTLL